MTENEIKEILENHQKWLNNDGGKKANLRGADLRGADLRYCIGNGKEIKSLQIGTYLISYTKDILNIGCQSYILDEWKEFSDEEIKVMDDGALEWWKLNKHIIIELAEREIKE